jgi:hypothetical protein
VQGFLVAKAQEVLKQRAAQKRPRISNAATILAHAVSVTGMSIPTVSAEIPTPKDPALPSSEEQSPPSFVPSVRHRGLLK